MTRNAPCALHRVAGEEPADEQAGRRLERDEAHRVAVPALGSRMKRSIVLGMRISAFIALPSLARASCSAIEKPRLGMNGKDAPGRWRAASAAERRGRGNDLRARRSRPCVTSGPSTSTIPCSARSARSSSQRCCWSLASSRPPRRCAQAARPASARPGSS